MKRIFYLLTLVLCVACQDDDTFSTSTGLRLSFPSDTLAIDTVFSRTPSSTYTFWVHNRNDEGIRLQTVRLRRGNQTGFRVNVDGVYLDNSNGSITTNVEIRRNDSILVFVELTAPESGRPEPVKVEDDLVFTLESGNEQRICLLAWTWDAHKLFSPVFSRDSVLEVEKPVVVFGDLRVEEGATLTIRNTTLYFHDGAGVEVYGSLRTENCIMRGDRLDDMFSYLPYDRVSGQWKGVTIHETSSDNEMLNTEIRNPMYGVVCDSAALDSTRYRLKMVSCVIHNCQGAGLKAVNSNVSLDHCQLSNTEGDCLTIIGGMADISYCTFAQFYPFSAGRGAALRFTNFNEFADIPLLRLSCVGSILTGYEDDVLMGENRNDEIPFDYGFRECLLRMPAVEDDSLHFGQIRWETPNDSIQGKKHFVKIDEENFIYDFHLDSLSTAMGLGCY